MSLFAADIFHPERFGLITGSRCTPLVPKKNAKEGMITLAKNLAMEKYFQFYDEVTTWRLQHGKLGETFAFQHYQKYFSPNVKEGRWIKDGDTGGNTDAEENDCGADFKCPTSLENWLEYLFEPIPDDNFNQAQLYMRLTGYSKWKICAYLIETNKMSEEGFVYPIHDKDRMIIRTVIRDDDWNAKFEANLPFVLDKREEYLQKLQQKFGSVNPG